jgi:NAD(P)-dependent dehydrogenase (short-subunit alcohol dehydrogenase family)
MNLSSHLGSRAFNNCIAANNDFAYGASKAALNMYSHLLAKNQSQFVVLSMAPGHVQVISGNW